MRTPCPLRLLTALLVTVCGCLPAWALDLPAGSKLQATESQDAAQVEFATARFGTEGLPVTVAEGQVLRQAWKLSGTSQTSFQILTALRDQLIADGFDILFQCQSVSCGGYDFRFQIGHFKAPDMFVDLGDFHYLSAHNEDAYSSVLVSRSKDAAFIELAQVDPSGNLPATTSSGSVKTSTVSNRAPTSGSLSRNLETRGRVVLNGLSFATGSSQLTDADVPVLAELAKYLGQNPNRTITLVGHTDAVGGLDGNIALSRKRATSVMDSLINLYGVKSSQISAQGVGFLMPRASNLTAEGRDANRRVEAVLTSTE